MRDVYVHTFHPQRRTYVSKVEVQTRIRLTERSNMLSEGGNLIITCLRLGGTRELLITTARNADDRNGTITV
jgi:hypothetical protein